MKSSVIVAAALMIGFVSVLVYRVSASDALGMGRLPLPAKSTDLASGGASPPAVEFIVQQCDFAMPDAILDASIPEGSSVRREEEIPRISAASPAIAKQWVIAEGIPEFVLEEEPIVGQAATIVLSPSILYIR